MTTNGSAGPEGIGNRIGGPGSLSGRRALVIGASSGIGLAAAETLLADGADVLICARDTGRLESAAESLRKAVPAGGGLALRTCDGMDGAQVAAAVEEAAGETGLDMAVSIPGGGNYCPVLGYDDDEFSATIDENVRPTYLMIKYAGLAMVRSGGGSIVVTSSTASTLSSPFLSAYCAAKAACDQLVEGRRRRGRPARDPRERDPPGLTRTGATDAIVREPTARRGVSSPSNRSGRTGPRRTSRAPSASSPARSRLDHGTGDHDRRRHTIRKFPWLEDVARAVAGEEVFDAIERGEAEVAAPYRAFRGAV